MSDEVDIYVLSLKIKRLEDENEKLKKRINQPVKRGKWLQHGRKDDFLWCCSDCKKFVIYAEHDLDRWHYCGNCGADMRGDTE